MHLRDIKNEDDVSLAYPIYCGNGVRLLALSTTLSLHLGLNSPSDGNTLMHPYQAIILSFACDGNRNDNHLDNNHPKKANNLPILLTPRGITMDVRDDWHP